jgi:hypothetical protein
MPFKEKHFDMFSLNARNYNYKSTISTSRSREAWPTLPTLINRRMSKVMVLLVGEARVEVNSRVLDLVHHCVDCRVCYLTVGDALAIMTYCPTLSWSPILRSLHTVCGGTCCTRRGNFGVATSTGRPPY